MSRADLAAWLRQMANQLETTGQLFYGAAGTVAVADQVRCELEIEQEGGDEFSVEIEFSWVNLTTVETAEPATETATAQEAEAKQEAPETTESSAAE